MRQTKTRMELFSIHDHVGITSHLEKQARKGWLLEKVGNWGWRYRKIEPQSLRFFVTYFPPASVFDPYPSEGEATFREYCEQAGWKVAASNAQLQVFYTADPNAVPVETDAVVQVENIHAAAKKTTLLSNWLFGIIGVINIITWLITFFENPVILLADYSGWMRAISFSILILLSCTELLSYYLWHRKAVEVAQETGCLHPTKSHRLLQIVSLVILIAALFLWFFVTQSRRTRIIYAMSLANMALLMALVQGCRILLQKLGVSKTKNKVITLTVDFVLAFLLIGMLPRWIMKMDLHDKTPVDTYVHYGIVREVYNDPLPVCVEDLLAVDPAGYSKELDVQKTVIAAIYDGIQLERRDSDLVLPDMDYRLVISEIPSWTEFFWNGWIEDYDAKKSVWTPYRYLEERDPTPWKAVEAQRSCNRDGEQQEWLIRWEDRFVRLSADWELTEEQMGIIAEKLRNYAE